MNAFLRGTSLSQKRNIIIEVHTDKAGSSKNNLKISKIRAHNAATSLYCKEYKFSKVYYNGFGESEPLIKYTGQADTGWIYFGNPSLKEKFTISCAEDKPRKVKRKAISRSDKSEFMPGYYSKRVKAKFNNTTLELYSLYIYENGYLPESNPMLSIYEDSSQVISLLIKEYRT